eukprot:scaffold110065_cov51-Phaeocystis_antarctica.AAC.1
MLRYHALHGSHAARFRGAGSIYLSISRTGGGGCGGGGGGGGGGLGGGGGGMGGGDQQAICKG